MARRRKQEEDAGAMDSLLDTMTNVVGILVIVLVVTQLGVGDAVQRISQSLDFDPEEIEKKREEVKTWRISIFLWVFEHPVFVLEKSLDRENLQTKNSRCCF